MNEIFELNMITTGIKTAAMLFIVLALLVLFLYLMKRFLFLRRETKGDLAIKVISSLHLSAKERIQVIEISGQRIVLGIAPGNISYLTELSDSSGKVGP
ncbi:MAG: flagellar biosynthetic protein FliO [Desulfobacterales bacterium]|nr:flagellar biosynthetic protein FliO [Desulfobacterales bacterium]